MLAKREHSHPNVCKGIGFLDLVVLHSFVGFSAQSEVSESRVLRRIFGPERKEITRLEEL